MVEAFREIRSIVPAAEDSADLLMEDFEAAAARVLGLSGLRPATLRATLLDERWARVRTNVGKQDFWKGRKDRALEVAREWNERRGGYRRELAAHLAGEAESWIRGMVSAYQERKERRGTSISRTFSSRRAISSATPMPRMASAGSTGSSWWMSSRIPTAAGGARGLAHERGERGIVAAAKAGLRRASVCRRSQAVDLPVQARGHRHVPEGSPLDRSGLRRGVAGAHFREFPLPPRGHRLGERAVRAAVRPERGSRRGLCAPHPQRPRGSGPELLYLVHGRAAGGVPEEDPADARSQRRAEAAILAREIRRAIEEGRWQVALGEGEGQEGKRIRDRRDTRMWGFSCARSAMSAFTRMRCGTKGLNT